MSAGCLLIQLSLDIRLEIKYDKYEQYNKSYYWGDTMKKATGKYAWSVTVGSKGQIVIPKEAREVFQICPGDTLLLLGDEERGLAIPRKETFDILNAAVFKGE